MCILFIHTGGPSVRGYRLILASNRDEYFDRPAAIAAPWEEDCDVIGGRDMEPGREGGTWLAASVSGCRVAALLNLPGDTSPQNAKGRGSIVKDFVLGRQSTEEYLQEFHLHGPQYSAFNLVTIHIGEQTSLVYHYSNADDRTIEYNKPEAIGFGNSCPDTPLRKVCHGKEQFERIVSEWSSKQQSKEQLIKELITLLKWDEKHYPDEELERRRGPNAPTELSAVFVNIPQVRYGTRTHTIILVDNEGNLDFVEWTMAQESQEWIKTHITRSL